MITSMQNYIESRGRLDKLRPTEQLLDVGNGPQVAISSYMDIDWKQTLQTMIDDLVVEHGYAGARKIVNHILDQVIEEHRHV